LDLLKKAQQQQQPQVKVQEPIEQLTVEEALKRLNDLVGLANVKKKVVEWVALVKSFKEREANGLPIPDGFSYHMVFTGNPGTGKTTVARIMAQIYRSLGILQNGQLVETARNDLVAGYIGQTAIKTQEAIDKALGGVLFVDEAYALVKKGSGNDFGQEAIDTILKNMEDHRNELVVIMAGYSGPMAELLQTNEGLTSRFSNIIEFEDYSAEELFKIFKGMCDKNSYVMDNRVAQFVKEEFGKLYETRNAHFGNARTVRNIFQKVVEKQALRLQMQPSRTKDDMMRIMQEDLPDFRKVK
jgi:SpoVK/Ycf46/Vps4 family AAA+-type ATPase